MVSRARQSVERKKTKASDGIHKSTRGSFGNPVANPIGTVEFWTGIGLPELLSCIRGRMVRQMFRNLRLSSEEPLTGKVALTSPSLWLV